MLEHPLSVKSETFVSDGISLDLTSYSHNVEYEWFYGPTKELVSGRLSAKLLMSFKLLSHIKPGNYA